MADKEYEIQREGDEITLRVNLQNSTLLPTIEDDPNTMAQVLSHLQQAKNVTKIVIVQYRDYEYDFAQTKMLLEYALMHSQLMIKNPLQELLSLQQNPFVQRMVSDFYTRFQTELSQGLKSDPYKSYTYLRRELRHCRIKIKELTDPTSKGAYIIIEKILQHVLLQVEQTSLIKSIKASETAVNTTNRDVYRQILSPLIRPDFMLTRVMSSIPPQAEEIDSFAISDAKVTIFKVPDTIQYLYHVMPPEFRLTDEMYSLLDEARTILAEHKPQKEEFTDPKRMREVFENIGNDLLLELIKKHNYQLEDDDVKTLSKILVRYTVGFGLIEVLLDDEEMQDISVNSPQGSNPIFIVHGKYDECVTNIIPTTSEAESWATKLRLISGRSLDEADPILDTELEFPNASVRVSAITYPLNPTGLAFSFRRHRDKPWTLPLFIKYKMINAMGAGLLSFLIDGSRSFLIAGTRSSGKSSFLSAMMVEIMRRYRMITIEDTLELPTKQLREIGFNIQPMKVASALGSKSNEMDASDGIRSTLRLGDSALIVGEVRSSEAKALYEAMRVGAAANVVAGTIHGDSPYGIFDRVVNDIGVPKTSFKATDIIVIANPIRSADGLHKYRRVLSITEVRKDWTDDPYREHGFVDLMKYNPITDELEPTDALIRGESEVLKEIAGKIKEFAGNWDAIWENIQLRGKIKEIITNLAIDSKHEELLEADFIVRANDQFHRLFEQKLSSDEIIDKFSIWMTREIRKKSYG